MRKKIITLSLIFFMCISLANAVFADWIKDDNNRYKYFNSAAGQYVVNNRKWILLF